MHACLAFIRPIVAVAALAAAGAPVAADEEAGPVYLRRPPPLVAALTRCAGEGPGTTLRRIFEGHIVFVVECPTLRLNFRHAIVVADAFSGKGARLVTFEKPHPKTASDPEDVLYTMDLFDSGEIGELFVDPEAKGVACRHVARWRFVGDLPKAELVSWRETDDCGGEGGWRVVVQNGRPAVPLKPLPPAHEE